MSAHPPSNDEHQRRRLACARQLLRISRHIASGLGRDLQATPALDMLLELYIERHGRALSLTMLAGATRVPERTALLTLQKLIAKKYVMKSPDPHDGRRSFVSLSSAGLHMLEAQIDAVQDVLLTR